MDKEIVKIEFNVWGNTQEGEELKKALCDFINIYGQMGIKVTASKMTEAINKWGNNMFVKSFFNK